ncbi:unnamed protein product [Lactuca virosa]|uniref:Uncharacterized protein n=1 Tax=Lactuca virosa TaxID=75947 RepID=A0AAU9N0U2_9ASTR|nr:unnamed protein product [Lactuca virosa]
MVKVMLSVSGVRHEIMATASMVMAAMVSGVDALRPASLASSSINNRIQSSINNHTSNLVVIGSQIHCVLQLPSVLHFLPIAASFRLAASFRSQHTTCFFPPVVAHSHHRIRFPVNFELLIFCLMQIWGALLGGYRIYKNVELASKIGQKIEVERCCKWGKLGKKLFRRFDIRSINYLTSY